MLSTSKPWQGSTRPLLLISFFCAGFWLLCCLIFYVHLPVSPDQALFDYVSWSVLTGQGLYTEVYEINWPGKIFIHMLGTYLFGPATWSFRMIDVIILLFLTAGMALFLRRIGFVLAPVLILFLYPALYVSSGAWMAGQRDIVAAGFLIVAAGFALPPVSSDRARATELFLSGIMIAFAVLIRPSVLPFIIGLLAIEHARLRQAPTDAGALRRSFWILTGFLGSLGALALYAAWQGSLSGWFEQTILFNTEVYAEQTATTLLLGQIIFLTAGSWHWLAVFSVFAITIWISRDRLTYGAVIILGLLATVLISYVAQNKGFAYHLGGFLTVFALLNAILIEHLNQFGRANSHRSGAFAILLIVAAIMSGGTFKKTTALWPEADRLMTNNPDPDQQAITAIATIVAKGSMPKDTFLQWGRAYHAPFLAQRSSPWPFINVPLRYGAHLSREWPEWKHLAEVGLRDKSPAFVLIARSDLAVSAESYPPLMRMVFDHIRTYEVVHETPAFVLYGRPAS